MEDPGLECQRLPLPQQVAAQQDRDERTGVAREVRVRLQQREHGIDAAALVRRVVGVHAPHSRVCERVRQRIRQRPEAARIAQHQDDRVAQGERLVRLLEHGLPRCE